MRINLFAPELATLLHEHSVDYNDTDFEKFFFELQTKVEISSGTMELQDEDLQQIQRFAFDYGNQKWKRELRAIFARTLGEDLDGSLAVEKVEGEEWEQFPYESRKSPRKTAKNGAGTIERPTWQAAKRRDRPEWERGLKTNQNWPSPLAD
jgi:hypothetical protein